MNAEIRRRIEGSLKSSCYTMNEPWLQECLEYCAMHISSDDLNKILDFITTQWHLSDLREINNDRGCLPPNLSQQKCVTLPGNYILQMNSFHDISTPKFKQLEKIRNISTDNIEVTEAEHVQTQAWEPTAKRMYQLSLTDGCQNVLAIENKPIKILNDNVGILPGTKFMIKGPVKCRRGVVILEDANLVNMGGEVESLLIPNAMENILARSLNLAENPNPYGNTVKAEESAVSPAQAQNLPASASSLDQGPPNPPKTNHQLLQHLQVTYSSEQETQSTTREKTLHTALADDSIDQETMDFLDQESSLTTGAARNAAAAEEKPNMSQGSVEFPDDDMDFQFDFEDVKPPVKPTTTIVDLPTNNTHNRSDDPSKARATIVKQEPESRVDLDSMDFQHDEGFNKPTNVLNRDKNDESSTASAREISTKFLSNTKTFHNHFSPCSASTSKPSVSGASHQQQAQLGVKRTNDQISPSVPSNPPKMKRIPEPKNTQKITNFIRRKSDTAPANNRKITDFTVAKVPKICDFLCDILRESLHPDEPCEKTINGKMVSITTKLDMADSKWCLSAKLKDSTGNIDVNFSSEVLEGIFGITVAQFKEKKALCKKDPEVARKLRSDITRAETKLKELDALVVLKLSKNAKPFVVKISNPTELQRQQINQLAKARDNRW